MTGLEIALLIILIIIAAFILYYYFRGTGGHVAITRPMESRVDEYLDRHFEMMVAEWSLMDRYQVKSFCANKEKALAAGEEKVTALRTFEEEMNTTLAGLEERINVLEKQICGE
ncbi:hypothetical protein AZH53_00415 [Methanomicrobiaceae archaeon CYW5]|uniref:hypothetical protein n=1 Tax=Methanovulcanius yangii TaxID=1789227 RepID=UPI0029C9B38D|nr:hypothetical protein [Methanovulcanius yangii]MBT8506892.1 hypothetical protein [Methanovulcanius yangii]